MRRSFLSSFLAILLPSFVFPAGSWTSEQHFLALETPSGRLEGTLQIPTAGRKFPVALIIAGSGPTDRDGNSITAKNNSLRLFAESLAKEGVASLRYDKRGVGASVRANPNEAELRFETYVDDAVAWAKKLENRPPFRRSSCYWSQRRLFDRNVSC